jgi:hypothetical protein
VVSGAARIGLSLNLIVPERMVVVSGGPRRGEHGKGIVAVCSRMRSTVACVSCFVGATLSFLASRTARSITPNR